VSVSVSVSVSAREVAWVWQRIVGSLYLAAVLADGALSAVALVDPSYWPASNLLSTGLLGLSVVVLVLGAARKLPPRAVFVAVPIVYLVAGMSGSALLLGVAMKLGLAAALDPASMELPFLFAQLPWAEAFFWVVTCVYTSVAAIGSAVFLRFLAWSRG
jgi:hypothetical protein